MTQGRVEGQKGDNALACSDTKPLGYATTLQDSHLLLACRLLLEATCWVHILWLFPETAGCTVRGLSLLRVTHAACRRYSFFATAVSAYKAGAMDLHVALEVLLMLLPHFLFRTHIQTCMPW